MMRSESSLSRLEAWRNRRSVHPSFVIELSDTALAKEDGCKVAGGNVVNPETLGSYVSRALFPDVASEMRTKHEEKFVPCASIIKAAVFFTTVKSSHIVL